MKNKSQLTPSNKPQSTTLNPNFNKLLECASPLLQLAAQFRQKEIANIDLNFRDQVMAAFDQFERMAFEHQILPTVVMNAKYALAAFIDEIVLSSVWPGRTTWMGTPLQLQFFGEHLAGENFFKRLNELRQNSIQNIEALEVYYVCLQLGFEGTYRLRGLEQLLALQVDLRSQIEMIRGVVDPHLSLEGLPKQHLVTKIGIKMPYWVMGSITLAVVFFIYFGYALAVDHQANVVLAKINNNRDMLLQELGDRSSGQY